MEYFVLMCMCVLSWTGSSADPCPFKECSCDPIQILCQSKGLHTVPAVTAQTNDSYQLLFLDANHITTIPAGSLLHNLKELSFLSNPITTIDDAAFDDSATTLEILTFSQATFTRIPDAFLHLKVLNYLYLYDTYIQDWNLNAMKNIGSSVNILYLGNNGLTIWPSWIQYFSNLTDLSISDSSISFIPDSALDSVALSLNKLSLIGNYLTSIPEPLSQLVALQFLAIQNTRVTDLSWLPRSMSLSTLELSNNQIADSNHLSDSLRHLAGSLKYLDLQGNNLTSIPDLSFLTILEDINLNYNQLSLSNNGSLPLGLSNIEIAFNYLPSIPKCVSLLAQITYLTLPRNYINVVQGTDFPPFTTVAELGYNLISELNDTSFPTNSSILILTLNNNPLASVSSQAFTNLPQLQTLNMQYTNLTRLPLALGSLTSLSMFDISGTKDLVCTCLDKSLATVLLGMSAVVGNCGQIDIVAFFTEIAPQCPVP